MFTLLLSEQMFTPNKYFVIIIMERVEELSSQFTEHCVQVSSQSTVSKSVYKGLCSSQFTEHCVQVHRGLCSSQYQRTAFKAVHRGMCSKSSQNSVQVSSMKIVFKSVHRGLWRTVAGG